MKTIAILFLIVAVVSGANLPVLPVRNLPRLPTVGLAGTAHRHVEKRQTLNELTNQDLVDCSTLTLEHQCSSGYAQRLVDIALGCGNDTEARLTSIACARNELGETCAAATLALTVDESQSTNAQQCLGAVTSGNCPSGCRGFLQFARSGLGCCINTYVNTTESPVFAVYGEFVDYRLWNLCNVDLPPADCGNALPLNPPPVTQNCTAAEYVARVVDYECMDNVSEPLVDAIRQNPRCNYFAELSEDSCEVNANDQHCAEVIGTSSSGDTSGTLLVESTVTNCGTSTFTCSSRCRSLLVETRDVLGCCVNIFNNSDIGLELPSLSYSVWRTCGVETPGFCEDLVSTVAPATPTAGEYSSTNPPNDDQDNSTNMSGETTPPTSSTTPQIGDSTNSSGGIKAVYASIIVTATIASLLI